MNESNTKKSRKQFYRSLIFFAIFYIVILITFTHYKFNKDDFLTPHFFTNLKSRAEQLYFTVFPTKITTATNLDSVERFNTPTPTMKVTPTDIPVAIVSFTSKELGISFSYPTKINKNRLAVRKIENTVYLYLDSKTTKSSDKEFLAKEAKVAKYVEVIEKQVQLSLIDAIRDYILNGISPHTCATSTDTNYGSPRIDKTYEHAVITTVLPKNKNLSRTELQRLSEKCTKYESKYYGVSYFMMDPKHPEKFLFVHLGQDNLQSGIRGYSWDETIKVF